MVRFKINLIEKRQRKPTKKWREWMGENWRNVAKAIVMLVLFAVLAIWLELKTGKMIEQLESIPTHYWWLGLGAVALVALIAWLLWSSARRDYAGGAMRSRWLWWPVVVLFLVAIGIGAYGYFPWSTYWGSTTTGDTADTIFTVVARPGKPAEGVMPPGWRMDWWGDPTKFDSSQVVWRGGDKVQLFHVKPGVDKAELKLRIYPCTARTPC